MSRPVEVNNSMNYQRIFTFGCSFTRYHWPTWADVLAVQSKLPTYNAAIAGLGNVGIAARLVEYDCKYHFTDTDLILVMWTSYIREDRYLMGEWQAHGNIFFNHYYDNNFVKKYWSADNDVIKNATAIILSNKAYNIKMNFQSLPAHESSILDKSKFEELYADALPKLTYFEQDQNFFNQQCKEGHPDILNHVAFYNKHIAGHLGFDTVQSNSVFHKWQDYAIANLPRYPTIEEKCRYLRTSFNKVRHQLSIVDL